jgi:hypothetical protein
MLKDEKKDERKTSSFQNPGLIYWECLGTYGLFPM